MQDNFHDNRNRGGNSAIDGNAAGKRFVSYITHPSFIRFCGCVCQRDGGFLVHAVVGKVQHTDPCRILQINIVTDLGCIQYFLQRMVSAHGFKDFVLRICQLTHDLSAPIVPRRADAGNKEVSMAREKEGYRDALERIRHEAAGELVTVPEAAHIVYGTDPYAARKVCRNFEGWTGQGRDKRIPATALARQIC